MDARSFCTYREEYNSRGNSAYILVLDAADASPVVGKLVQRYKLQYSIHIFLYDNKSDLNVFV